MPSRRYVDTTGAIAGRSQFGHRILVAGTLSTGLGAGIRLSLVRLGSNSFEVMVI
jgi:hypothetical protein